MSTWALVPVKARHAGKQRLAPLLPDALRARLVRGMLNDVLGSIAACEQIAGTLVMSPERDELAAGTQVLRDPAERMNDALPLAIEALRQRGAKCVAIIAADLPLLRPADITALVTAARGGIALAPDASGTGTNAACLGLPTTFRFHYGPGSFALHQAEAARRGMTAISVALPGLEFDIDEAADLAQLRARGLPRYEFLR